MSHAAKLLQTAVSHHQAGQLAEAEKAYHKLLRVEPVNNDGLRLLGGLYLQQGQLAAAAAQLEKALRTDPRNPETLTNLGVAYRGLKRTDEAVAKYHQALDIEPKYLSALNNLASLYQEAGRTAEALATYDRLLRLHPANATAQFNYGNCLLATGKPAQAVEHYEAALRLKPDYLDAMINLGMVLSQIGKSELSRQWLGVARTWFDKALALDPNNAVALNNIANILRQQGKPEEAVAYYRKALEARPDYADAAVNMSSSLRDLHRLDEAIEVCRQALQWAPRSFNARLNLGTFMQDLMRHEEAIAYFDEVLAIKPTLFDAKWNKSLSLLALGRYAEGLALHETGLGIPHMRGENPAPDRRWKGEDLNGKRLLIWREQGLGDNLQFIRYTEICKAMGAAIIVLCHNPLRALFANCPFIDALPEILDEKDFDYHVPIMSLPYVLGTTVETIPDKVPYLFVSAATRALWKPRLPDSNKFKVGLVWAGNPRENQIDAHMADRKRSMDLERLRPLFGVAGVQFYNLQMGAKVAQIDSAGLRDRFIDPMPDVKNFEDTAAIVEQLDLVISVDTSVVHLAGGMGKPVWVLSRFDACWRWMLNRVDSPWYPSARIFGQTSFGDWDGVVISVQAALADAVAKRQA